MKMATKKKATKSVKATVVVPPLNKKNAVTDTNKKQGE
jgi:hypothetical protein